eukprot:1136934-Pelagomonas_calceolata.AAC.7
MARNLGCVINDCLQLNWKLETLAVFPSVVTSRASCHARLGTWGASPLLASTCAALLLMCTALVLAFVRLSSWQ